MGWGVERGERGVSAEGEGPKGKSRLIQCDDDGGDDGGMKGKSDFELR